MRSYTPIIQSILDTDLYKFTMMFAVLQKFPGLRVKYRFKDRNKQVYPKDFGYELARQISLMSSLTLTPEEEEFLQAKVKFLPQAFVDFLKGYRFDPSEVAITQHGDGTLDIEIEGLWYHTILWEVPILAIISELFFKMTGQMPEIELLSEHDVAKVTKLQAHNAHFSDFGTRRRYSYANQDRIIQLFSRVADHHFTGTSNVHFAHKYNINVMGTLAHEWIMAHGALYGYRMANKLAMENWVDVYQGDLGMALTDTYTSDNFLQSFDMKYSKLFDGVRQDSGDPYEYADKFIAHYLKLKTEPLLKTIIFSNALDVDTACDIKEYCVGKIKSAFGIGTHFTNDVGVKPMNIVIKLSAVLINDIWYDCVKLSDDEGKNTGFDEELHLCRETLKIK